MTLRYLYLQTHYRQEMNFTYPSLDAAQNAYKKLLSEIAKWDEPAIGRAEFEQRFIEAINDDLNTPQALAIMWELVKSDYPSSAKAESLFKMDKVLGLSLQTRSIDLKKERGIVPEHIKALVKERRVLRSQRMFSAADQIRAKIDKLGYEIEDTKKGTKVWKK